MERSTDTEVQGRAGAAAPIYEGPAPQDDHVGDVSLAARLYGSRHTHRLLPAGLALRLVGTLGPAVRERMNPAERRDAERFMRELLQHTPRAAEADELARLWLLEKARLRELFWRPWLLKRSRVFGAEHWDAARAQGRGCVIAFGHLVQAWAVPSILGYRGFDHYTVVGPHYWQPMPPGYEGLALLHRRREYGEKPFRAFTPPRPHGLISTEGRPQRLPELLAAGMSIAIAFDAPGRARTPYLGRAVGFGGGPASLAFPTRCLVLPVVPERQGSVLHLRFYPPLDPADYEDARSLRAAIARAFEPIVLANPEIVELAWHPSHLVVDADARQPAEDQPVPQTERTAVSGDG